MAHRSHPEILCSVPHRASDKAAPFLHRPFRFHVSGTQRTYFTMNLGVMPLTLAPKSDSDFRRECALTHSKAFGKNTQPAPERCRSERVWDFPTSILQRKICICAHECTACKRSSSRFQRVLILVFNSLSVAPGYSFRYVSLSASYIFCWSSLPIPSFPER